MSYFETTSIKSADSPSIDSFSRLRVSNPESVFDAQLTYNLQPLLFEQLTTGAGASIAHDATNRMATLTFASTATGGVCAMQSFEHFRYQPGKSQLVFVTFNMNGGVADVVKFAGYSDGSNGIEFLMDGTTPKVRILSDTTNGDQTVTQDDWNLDKLDGTGASGISLNLNYTQILVIDFQALYVGRVRIGFDVDGLVVYCHEFLHANLATYPYIQTANLPIRVGMTCTATVSTTMNYICSAVASEGGQEFNTGFHFETDASVTAGSGTRTHMMSLRPKTTFNSITNDTKLIVENIELLVTGNNPILWELCIGQALTTPTYADVNATYSSTEKDTAGTLSGSPAIVIASGFVGASASQKGTFTAKIGSNYPITLTAAGAVRDLGTLTLLVTGLGGTTACRAALGWKEVR